jgi:hypothetical protein
VWWHTSVIPINPAGGLLSSRPTLAAKLNPASKHQLKKYTNAKKKQRYTFLFIILKSKLVKTAG